MKTPRNRIIPLAREARRWIERLADERSDFIYEDMSGGCALASAYLMLLAHSRGMKATVRLSSNHAHCYIEGYTVDVTATQFFSSGPWVILKNPEKHPKSRIWEWCFEAHDLDSLLNYMDEEWPYDVKMLREYIAKERPVT